jgi:hypothetical protein
MEFETTTYNVCPHFLPAIVNDDITGLEPEEYQALERWYESEGLTERSGHFDCDCDGNTSFAMCDIVGLKGDTVELRFLERVE